MVSADNVSSPFCVQALLAIATSVMHYNYVHTWEKQLAFSCMQTDKVP